MNNNAVTLVNHIRKTYLGRLRSTIKKNKGTIANSNTNARDILDAGFTLFEEILDCDLYHSLKTKEKAVFYVNEVKKIIVCKLQVNNINPYTSKGTVFTARAKCSSDDEWNESIGMKIAYNKAKLKFYARLQKNLNLIKSAIEDMTYSLDDASNILMDYSFKSAISNEELPKEHGIIYVTKNSEEKEDLILA